jgi:hypothetical protein
LVSDEPEQIRETRGIAGRRPRRVAHVQVANPRAGSDRLADDLGDLPILDRYRGVLSMIGYGACGSEIDDQRLVQHLSRSSR